MLLTNNSSIYLDYNATTPTDKRVVESMIPVLQDQFGNPSSEYHNTGRTAGNLVEESRHEVAGLVDMKPSDVIFTSGATEANNMALCGFVYGSTKTPRILAGATEHKSVLETCRMLDEKKLAQIDIVPVNADGTIDTDKLRGMLPGADLVSIMAANSETGVINPIDELVGLVHEHGALFHCDATQAIGRIPFDAGDIDMLSISSHKIYGPKGCGALIATRHARKRLQPILYGGGQERDMRSGTLNVPGIVGFGVACTIASKEGLQDSQRQESLRDHFEQELSSRIDGISINGAGYPRLPNTSNVRLTGALADAVMVNAPRIEISTGSACSSAAMEPSHVLTAMGLTRDEASECIRVSIGRGTTKEDIDMAIDELVRAVSYVRGVDKPSSETVYNAH